MLSWNRAINLRQQVEIRPNSLEGRHAWRVLARAGDRGNENAIVAAQQIWQYELTRSDPESWTGGKVAAALARWGLPGYHSPVERALIYVLTGQAAQHRAADPDGTLLAAGYRAARPHVQAAIREAITGSGDLDLIRILVSDRESRPLTPQEQDYLIAQLTGRQDWAGLWRAVRALPLASAVAAVRHFPDHWHPGDPGSRELLGLLQQPGPGQIATARDELATPRNVRIGDRSTRYAFTADGSRLAIRSDSPESWSFRSHSPESWSLFALPSGILRRTCLLPAWARNAIPYVAIDDTILGIYWPKWQVDRYREAMGPSTILANWDDGTFRVIRPDLHPQMLLAYPGGFVADQALHNDRELVFCDAYGRIVRAVMLGRDLGIRPAPFLCAVDNDSGHLALWSNDGRLCLLDRYAERVLASAPLSTYGSASNVRFYDPERLVTFGDHGVLLWLYTGTGLEVRATASRWMRDLAVFPARGEIAVTGGGWVQYLDARTLTEIAPSRPVPGNPGTDMRAGPDGRSYVMTDYDRGRLDYVADKYPAGAVALADRPLAELTPADLAVVSAALRYDGPPGPRPFLELLLACLEHQFGTEVTLAALPLPASPDDIALSPPAPAELPE